MRRLTPAVVPVIVCGIVGGFDDHLRFWPGLLAGLSLALAVTAGGLVVALGGAPDRVRPLMWLARGLAFVTILFVVLVVAGRYVWAAWWSGGGPDGFHSYWLVPEAFVARNAIYLLVLTTIAARASKRPFTRPLGPRVAAIVLAAAAGVDWIGSLHPASLSLAYAGLLGLAFVASGVVGALAVGVLATPSTHTGAKVAATFVLAGLAVLFAVVIMPTLEGVPWIELAALGTGIAPAWLGFFTAATAATPAR